MPSGNSSRILLIGGGHSHVQFLKSWAQDPIASTEVCLVSDVINTPYSGMLPGRLAGWYSDQEMHFNLLNLCAQAGVTFIEDSVVSLNATQGLATLAERPPLAFDVASINVGLTPMLPPGAAGNPRVTAVKPIAHFLNRWHELMDECGDLTEHPWMIVGGGAAGFELSMALAMAACRGNRRLQIQLLEAGPEILPMHSSAVRRRALKILEAWGIRVRVNCAVKRVHVQLAELSGGGEEPFERMLVTTAGVAAGWLKNTDLPLSHQGFVEIDSCLQSVKGRVFAAGDCAHFRDRPLAKSGVYAVRMGPILTENLRRAVRRESELLSYHPQRKTLSLMLAGDRRALLSYGPLALEGAWLWRWKNRIDRQFMTMFGGQALGVGVMAINSCGGCGGKAPAQLVTSVVRALALPEQFEDVGYLGDTAITVDGFRTFTEDLHLFGRVAVLHAFNDLFASGTCPAGATVMATLPPAAPTLRANQLLHLMKGVTTTLAEHQTQLLNAHTAEGSEAALTLTCLGGAGRRWSKVGLAAGQDLILTKPLGVGALLQGLKQGRLSEEGYRALKESLLLSHGSWLARNQVTVDACTDISGFGLVGHLSEMIGAARGASLSVNLSLEALTPLADFFALDLAGVSAFLTAQNRAAYSNWVDGPHQLDSRLYDPQTNGPLLIAVRGADSAALLQELRQAGFLAARVIGHVAAKPAGRILVA